MSSRSLIVMALLGLLPAAVPAAPAIVGSPVTEVHYVMGTYLTLTLDGLDAATAHPLMRRCFQEVRRLEGIFSRYDRASELSRLNQKPSARGSKPSEDFRRLLHLSLALGRATDGRFNIGIGALTLPDPLAVAALRLARSLEPPRWEVSLGRDGDLELGPGTQLDFDGIAKGYAVDRCVALLRAAGVRRALINFGESSQYALGAPSGEAAWVVALRGLAEGESVAQLELRDQSLSVSSALVARDGQWHAHIFDPRTGEVVRGAAMVAVVAPSAAVAEAWSKGLLLPARPAALAASEGEDPMLSYSGALRITASGVERLGRIDAVLRQQPLAADAEPLR